MSKSIVFVLFAFLVSFLVAIFVPELDANPIIRPHPTEDSLPLV